MNNEKNSVSSFDFNFAFRAYVRHRPFFLSLIRAKEAALYHQYLPLKAPVLDVGCGDGFFTRSVFGSLDVGLDIPDSRIGQAFRDGGYKKIGTYNGTVFPFPSNTFETVVSNCVLEHIPNIDQTLGEIKRVLRKNGTILVTVMAQPWEDHLFGALFLGNSYKQYMRTKQAHLNVLTDAEWRKVFANAGLYPVKTVGYLTPSQCKIIDISHYLSIPSLLSYMLTGKWVLIPDFVWYPWSLVTNFMTPCADPKQAGAIFYELQKK